MGRKSTIPEEKIGYFDKPTMVKFKDWEGNILGGIAYCGEIICGECGGIFDLEEDDEIEIVEILSWIDISDSIL